MHYADPKTLKRDEDFNIHIAGMENIRNSGNPLAEMLPDMRTPAVVMAAVKRDFRNLRYATPSMERYDEMIAIAKKQALEKVRELGQATDVRPLLPKVLRDDSEFMVKVEKTLKGAEGK
jgi:Trk K+ transport system NAD-binding subunit